MELPASKNSRCISEIISGCVMDKISLLPNKFFEFVQGRLAVGVGPTPDMASLVREHNLGVVSRDFSSRAMARELNGLEIKDIEKFKGNAHRAARELSFEPSAEIFMAEVGRLLSR